MMATEEPQGSKTCKGLLLMTTRLCQPAGAVQCRVSTYQCQVDVNYVFLLQRIQKLLKLAKAAKLATPH